MGSHVGLALREVRSRLASEFGTRLNRVVLFGSVARGDATEDSDVDVLVVIDRLSSNERGCAMDIAGEAGFDRGLVISPLVLSQAEWDDLVRRERRLVAEIQAEGIDQ